MEDKILISQMNKESNSFPIDDESVNCIIN